MSSFDTLESSLEDGRPLEIYTIALGGTVYRYTSFEGSVTVGADTYEPIAIQRGPISQGADERNKNLVINMPSSNSFASQYRNVVPAERATVSIIRLQLEESPTFNTQVLIYKGSVKSVRFPNNGAIAEVTCRSLEASAAQNIPRYTYMSSCNHLLYSPACGVNPASFDHIGTGSNVSGNSIDVSGLNASGLVAQGGYATPTGTNDFRMVLSQSGDTINLLLPFASDPTGLNVQVFAGCDHKLTGNCANLFDNVLEFGGFAFVPNKNIFNSGLD